MTEGILSDLIKKTTEDHAEIRSESYAMVNVRPGEKISAMLEVLCKLSKKTPSAVVTDRLSQRLAEFSVSSSSHAAAILEATEKTLGNESYAIFQNGSALDILKRCGVVELETELNRALKLL